MNSMIMAFAVLGMGTAVFWVLTSAIALIRLEFFGLEPKAFRHILSSALIYMIGSAILGGILMGGMLIFFP